MGEMITIPLEEYRRLQSAAADLADLRAFDRVTTDLAAGREELLPAEFVRRMIGGEAPLRVWREFRGLTQAGLADASGVNRVQIADIEAGRKSGSVETVRRLAQALGVAIEDLI
jgi:mRNA interferase RelE/StbE